MPVEDLNTLAVFAKVVEHESFTRAAGELGMSKSAVSKQIARLEDRLGARLLNRTTRKLAPTEVGRAFYERCRRIVTEAEEAERAVTDLSAAPRGRLRVAAPMSFGILHLGPVLPGFMTRYPDVEIDLVLNDRRVDLIEEGFDLAIRIADLPDSSLIAKKLAPARRRVVATPAYWDQHGRPSHPRDLANHVCLRYAYLPNPNEWPFEGPEGPFTQKVSGPLIANNGDVLLAAVLAGLGVLMSPTFFCGEAAADGRLEAVLDDYEAGDVNVYAVYPHSRHLSAKIRAFVDYLADAFGPTPYWDAPRVSPPPERPPEPNVGGRA